MHRSPLLPAPRRDHDDRPTIRMRHVVTGETHDYHEHKRGVEGFTDLALTGDPVDAEISAAILNASFHRAWLEGERSEILDACAPLAAMRTFSRCGRADGPQRDHDAMLAIALWLRTFDPASDELADACDVAAAQARARGANEPTWAGEEGRFDVVGCRALYEPGKQWRDLHLGFRAPCGTEHSIVTTSTGGARPELANLKVESPFAVLTEAFSGSVARAARPLCYDEVGPGRALEVLDEQITRARATRFDRLWDGGGFTFLPMLETRMRMLALAAEDAPRRAPFEA